MSRWLDAVAVLAVAAWLAACSSPTPSVAPRDRLDVIVRNLSAAPAKLHIDAPGGSPSGADSTALACNLAAVSVGVFGAWQVSVDGQPVLASDDDSIPELSPEERMEVRMTVDAAGDPQLDSVGAIAIGAGVFNDASGLAPLLPSPADCAS